MWWRDLKKVTRLEQYLNWFDNNLTQRLGKGNKFNFWHDKWNRELSLAPNTLGCITIHLKNNCWYQRRAFGIT